MATKASEYTTGELEKYSQHVARTATLESDKLQELLSFQDNCRQCASVVGGLPEKLRHDVFVPFGSLAFFPGQLVHTSELMVHIGSGYHIECTAKKAAEILSRRAAFISQQIEKQQHMVQSLEARNELPAVALTHDSGEGVVDIRENVDESDGMLAQARGVGVSKALDTKEADNEFSKLMARLSHYEKLEQAEQEDGEEEEDEAEEDSGSADSDDDPSYSPAAVPEVPPSLLAKQDKKTSAIATTSVCKQQGFKKGFLLSGRSSSTKPAGAGQAASPVVKQAIELIQGAQKVDSEMPKPQPVAVLQKDNTAFTGQVVERTGGSGTDAPVPALLKPSQPMASAPARLSKFKQRLKASH